MARAGNPNQEFYSPSTNRFDTNKRYQVAIDMSDSYDRRRKPALRLRDRNIYGSDTETHKHGKKEVENTSY